MSEWLNNQQKPTNETRRFPREHIEKANERHNSTVEETKRSANLETIADKHKREENAQNARLQTWLSDDECAQLELESQE